MNNGLVLLRRRLIDKRLPRRTAGFTHKKKQALGYRVVILQLVLKVLRLPYIHLNYPEKKNTNNFS